MKNKFDKQGFKKFLQLYNRWLCSVIGCEVENEVITDEELEFLYKIYEEIEFQKPINKQLTK